MPIRLEDLRKIAAEALGTGLLVSTVVGAGIMAERLTEDSGLALLGNALPTAAMLVVLISLLGPVSGAHFNPVVTLVFMLRREISGKMAALYMAGQVVGGMAGVTVAHAMFAVVPLTLSGHERTGVSQWLAEVVATLGLILVVLLGQRNKASLPALVGLYIGSAYWFTASTSFANPAVTVARAFTNSFSGIALIDVPAFIAAQIVGGLAGLALASWLQPQIQQGRPA
ncbi:Glycerol uptake facilitator (Major Intrinsic Protein Family) [Devosia sp. YR412]|uniref:aquaporin n=1 Tax=Devosia sp. YR412 TaxID=1881030 RepID=UPI0008BCE3FD|nr:MIP/aquaporin family protein [Devosia sp. YR412]SEQ27324.1 Glycerol uptake facilitator (Major Intrinsic Protein Family) [Devosia sp. YR412]